MNNHVGNIRNPAVAALFFPANAVGLTQTIGNLYSSVKKKQLDGTPAALVVPHAGYPCSGHTAAVACKLLEDEQFDTVVVVPP